MWLCWVTEYQPPYVEPPGDVPVLSVMLGVGVVLILVILAAIFARIWYIKKRRNAMKLPRE